MDVKTKTHGVHSLYVSLLITVALLSTGCRWLTPDRPALHFDEILDRARIWVPSWGLPMDGTGRLALGEGWRPWQENTNGSWFPQTDGRAPAVIFLDIRERTDLQIRIKYPPGTAKPRWVRLNNQDTILITDSSLPEDTQAFLAPAATVLHGKNELKIGGGDGGTVIRQVDVFQGGVFRQQSPESDRHIIIATLPFMLEFELTVPENGTFTIHPWLVSADAEPSPSVSLSVEIEDGSGNRKLLRQCQVTPGMRQQAPEELSLGPWSGREVSIRLLGTAAMPASGYLHMTAHIM